jgi:DNA-directed RNA polymerase subunit RPC12/RpoP
MIRFVCPHCQKKIKVAPEGAGRTISCPRCRNRLVVPSPTEDKPAPPTGQVLFHCPGCGRAILLQPDDLNQKLKCSVCGTHFVPAEPRPPPVEPEIISPVEPEVISPKSWSLAIPNRAGLSPFDTQPEPLGHVHRVEHFHSGFIETRSQTDAPGVISLICGCIALLCVLLGCLTFGFAWFVAVPFAIIGAGFGFGAKGNLRVAGLVLNLLVFIPVFIGVILLVAVVGITALGTSPNKSEPSKQRNNNFEKFDKSAVGGAS